MGLICEITKSLETSPDPAATTKTCSWTCFDGYNRDMKIICTIIHLMLNAAYPWITEGAGVCSIPFLSAVFAPPLSSSVMWVPTKFEARDPLYLLTLDGQGGGVLLVPPEVKHDFLCCLDVHGQVVFCTPYYQFVNFISVGGFVAVGDLSHHGCVISNFYYTIWGVGEDAVIYVDRIKQWATPPQNIALLYIC